MELLRHRLLVGDVLASELHLHEDFFIGSGNRGIPALLIARLMALGEALVVAVRMAGVVAGLLTFLEASSFAFHAPLSPPGLPGSALRIEVFTDTRHNDLQFKGLGPSETNIRLRQQCVKHCVALC